MGNRGRKSSNELATIPVLVETRRPPPPAELTETESTIWRDVIGTMPLGWFSKAQFPILVSYCRHTVRATALASEINRYDQESLKSEGGFERFNRLLAMAERETRALTSCARAMRLTHQSQLFPRGAGRRIAGSVAGHNPWEFPQCEPLGNDPMFDDYVGDEHSQR